MKASLLALIVLLALLWAASAVAQPSASSGDNQIITLSGTTYKNAVVQKVTPNGLVITYSPTNGGVGAAKVKFVDLPHEMQHRYGYNSTNAAKFEKAEQEGASQLRAQLIAADEQARSNRLANELSGAYASARRSGTGFFITDDGYLLTCYHVVTNATRIVVGTAQGVWAAQLVQKDVTNDLALLKVSGVFAALPLAASDGVKLGGPVFTVGFPNPGAQGMQSMLARGEISSFAGMHDDSGKYQISLPVQPGNSGGAVVDEFGNVAGIVVARPPDRTALAASNVVAQAVNYAVARSCVETLLDAIPELPGKLKPPHPPQDRKFEDVLQEAQNAVALVMVN